MAFLEPKLRPVLVLCAALAVGLGPVQSQAPTCAVAGVAFARPAVEVVPAHASADPQGCILVYSGTRRRCIDTCTEGKTCGVLVEESPDGSKFYSCNHEECPGAECITVFVKPPLGDPFLDCAGGPCGEDCRKTIKPGKGGKQDRSCVCDP